jgi:hypothetical protein
LNKNYVNASGTKREDFVKNEFTTKPRDEIKTRILKKTLLDFVSSPEVMTNVVRKEENDKEINETFDNQMTFQFYSSLS